MINEFVAIDPLALMFPTSIYLILVEKRDPHGPIIGNLAEAVQQMNPRELAFTHARVRTLAAYVGAVEKALNQGQ